MAAYYNEIDPKAAAWLRELIKRNLIAPGEVDERSILDVIPSDLAGFVQCHFFAGIGVWSYALRCAGWSDDRPVWTGSCPCQPFSAAGQRKGVDDERHLWPTFHWLISQRHPHVVFGEQVESKDGRAWLDAVQADMEGLDYAFGPFALPAAGFGAPHPRHRCFFVAESVRTGRAEWGAESGSGSAAGSSVAGELAHHHHHPRLQGRDGVQQRAVEWSTGSGGVAGGVADTEDPDGRRARNPDDGRRGGPEAGGSSATVWVGDTQGSERRVPTRQGWEENSEPAGAGGRISTRALEHAEGQQEGVPRFARESGATRGYWGDAHWISCRGGKWRPIEPGTFPLAHGAPARMGRLRGYGNAIVAPVAQEFIEAYMNRSI